MTTTTIIQTSYNFNELRNSVRHKGADETLAIVQEYGMERDLLDYMNEYWETAPTMTEVEQWLAFDRDNIFEAIELDFEAWEAEKEAAEA